MTPLQKIGLICICLMLMLSIVVPDYAMAQSPPPRPPPGAGSGGGNGDSDDGDHSDDDIILGDIYGVLTDFSTGSPGRGLTIMINDIPIKTDASGHFSLAGIADGTYIVDLRSLPLEFTPAQPAQTVIVANRERIDIELGYYSITPPDINFSDPADTLQQTTLKTGVDDDSMASSFVPFQVNPQIEFTGLEVASLEKFPQTLPETGGAFFPIDFALHIFVLGMLLWMIGMIQPLLWLDP